MEIEYCPLCEEPHDVDVPASGNIGNWRDLSTAREVDGATPFVGTLVPNCSLPVSIAEGSLHQKHRSLPLCVSDIFYCFLRPPTITH